MALSHTDGCGMGSSQPTLNPPLAKTTRDPRRTTAQGKESGKFSPKVIFFNFFFLTKEVIISKMGSLWLKTIWVFFKKHFQMEHGSV